jgi:hypothetical protein
MGNSEDRNHSSTNTPQAGRNTNRSFWFLGFLNSMEKDNYSDRSHSNKDVRQVGKDTSRSFFGQSFPVSLLLNVKDNSGYKIRSSTSTLQAGRNTNRIFWFLGFLNSMGKSNYSDRSRSNIDVR